MDQEVIQFLIISAFGGVFWFMKRTMDKADERILQLEKDLVQVKSEYLHKDEFKDFKMELRSMFEEIKTDIRLLRNPNV